MEKRCAILRRSLARDQPLLSSIRSPDRSKSETPVVIRATRATLTTLGLRKLRGDVFRLQLSLLQQMVENGVDPHRGDCTLAQVISTVESLQGMDRER